MTEPETDWLGDVCDEWPTQRFHRVDHDDRSPRTYEAAPRWPVRERVGELHE